MPLEKVDSPDMDDTTEEIDSLESLLLNCWEGLRGGSAGERCANCDEDFLAGSRGGGVGLAEAAVCPVRVISGGGRTEARPVPTGSFATTLP